MTQAERAELIAHLAFAGMPRPGLPKQTMLSHIKKVVSGVDGDLAIAVAWLHDSIEDTTLTADDLLGLGVSPTVVQAIELLTHDSSTLAEYADYIQSIALDWTRAGALARTVKVSDLKANLDAPDRLRRAGKPRIAHTCEVRYAAALETLTGPGTGAETVHVEGVA